MSLISTRDLNKNEVNENLLREDFRTRTHSILLKVSHVVVSRTGKVNKMSIESTSSFVYSLFLAQLPDFLKSLTIVAIALVFLHCNNVFWIKRTIIFFKDCFSCFAFSVFLPVSLMVANSADISLYLHHFLLYLYTRIYNVNFFLIPLASWYLFSCFPSAMSLDLAM